MVVIVQTYSDKRVVSWYFSKEGRQLLKLNVVELYLVHRLRVGVSTSVL